MFDWNRISTVTKYLLGINIGVFLVTMLLPFYGVVKVFGLTPSLFWAGAFWQPLSSMFMHGGLFHLLMNMMGLWSIGMFLERSIGSKYFLKLYFLSGFTSALFVVLFQGNPSIPTVGASGAIFGLLGALAVLYPNSPLVFFVFPVRARTAALVLGVVSFLFALSDGGSGISHLGHLGGLLGGLAYAKFLIPKYAPGSWSGGPNARGAGSGFNREDAETVHYDPVTGRFYRK